MSKNNLFELAKDIHNLVITVNKKTGGSVKIETDIDKPITTYLDRKLNGTQNVNQKK